VRRSIRGQLADVVDDAAGIVLAVEHGGRPAQHLEALRTERIDRQISREIGRFKLQAVFVDDVAEGREAAQLDAVATGIDAEQLAVDARGVAHRIVQCAHPLGRHLVARYDGDRLRDLAQRRIGLGAGGAAGCDEALHRAGCGLAACRGRSRHGVAGGRRRRGIARTRGTSRARAARLRWSGLPTFRLRLLHHHGRQSLRGAGLRACSLRGR